MVEAKFHSPRSYVWVKILTWAAVGLPIFLTLGADFTDPSLFLMTATYCWLNHTTVTSALVDAFRAIAIRTESRGETQPGAPVAQASAPIALKKPRLSGRVLVAEDNIVVQKIISNVLERMGLSCHIASNGNEAIRALEESKYDLILMDCQMPEKDGYEATREIRARQNQIFLQIPIIAMTSNDIWGDQERCFAAGMNDYLTKPVNGDKLYDLLSRFMSPGLEAEAPSIEYASLEKLKLLQCEGDPDLITELIDLLLANAPQFLSKMASLIETGDTQQIRREAHALKSSSRTLGAKRLGDLCERIEYCCTDKAALLDLLEQLKSEYARVEEELSRLRRKSA